MTDWKVRIPGRRAIGPVSTELLVRGIKAGRVPLDAEASEVGKDAWQPLASVDEFFEAMGLDDAETRVLDAPARPRAPEKDEDDDEEAATRVLDALREADDEDDVATRLVSAPPKEVGPDEDEETRLMTTPHRPRPVDAATSAADVDQERSTLVPGAPPGGRRPAANRLGSQRHEMAAKPIAGRHASSPRVAPQSLRIRGGGPGPSAPRRLDLIAKPVQGTRPAVPKRRPNAPASSSYEQENVVTAVAPVESPLLDAAEDEEESGSLSSKARERFPSIRPIVTTAELHQPVASGVEAESRRPETGAGAKSPPGSGVDRADELTAPALRLQRAYVRTRAALLLIMGILIVVLLALVVLLLLR